MLVAGDILLDVLPQTFRTCSTEIRSGEHTDQCRQRISLFSSSSVTAALWRGVALFPIMINTWSTAQAKLLRAMNE